MPSKIMSSLKDYSLTDRDEILLIAVEHENQKNPNARIHVIDIDELEQHIRSHDSNHQVIVRNSYHYTVVDVRDINGKKSCIVLDSAMDYRGTEASELLKASGFDVYFVKAFNEREEVENIQFDLYSCSMFAMDHCVQLSHAPDALYQHLQEKREQRSDQATYWIDFPPNFLWNAQSLSKVLGPYEAMIRAESPELLQRPMPNGLSYLTYTQQGRIMVKKEKEDGVCEVEQNDSINVHVFSKAQALYLVAKAQHYELYKQMKSDIEKIEAMPASEDRTKTIKQLKELQSDFAAQVKMDPHTSSFFTQFNSIVRSLNDNGMSMKAKIAELKNQASGTSTESVDVNDKVMLDQPK